MDLLWSITINPHVKPCDIPHCRHPQVLEAMIARLKLEFYAQGEYIIYQNDHSTEMYFIVEVATGPLCSTILAATLPSLPLPTLQFKQQELSFFKISMMNKSQR